MKFWSQKFPRQARLRSEKSLDGPQWASRQKKFLRNQKMQELFRGKPSQRPRRRPSVRKRARDPGAVQMSAKRARDPGACPSVRQASQRPRRCPGVRQASQRPRQPAKRQQLSQNPRHPSLIPSRVLSISRSGILHKRSKS